MNQEQPSKHDEQCRRFLHFIEQIALDGNPNNNKYNNNETPMGESINNDARVFLDHYETLLLERDICKREHVILQI